MSLSWQWTFRWICEPGSVIGDNAPYLNCWTRESMTANYYSLWWWLWWWWCAEAKAKSSGRSVDALHLNVSAVILVLLLLLGLPVSMQRPTSSHQNWHSTQCNLHSCGKLFFLHPCHIKYKIFNRVVPRSLIWMRERRLSSKYHLPYARQYYIIWSWILISLLDHTGWVYLCTYKLQRNIPS